MYFLSNDLFKNRIYWGPRMDKDKDHYFKQGSIWNSLIGDILFKII